MHAVQRRGDDKLITRVDPDGKATASACFRSASHENLQGIIHGALRSSLIDIFAAFTTMHTLGSGNLPGPSGHAGSFRPVRPAGRSDPPDGCGDRESCREPEIWCSCAGMVEQRGQYRRQLLGHSCARLHPPRLNPAVAGLLARYDGDDRSGELRAARISTRRAKKLAGLQAPLEADAPTRVLWQAARQEARPPRAGLHVGGVGRGKSIA